MTGLAEILEEPVAGDNDQTDGIINFELIESGATLLGRLEDTSNGPVPGFIVVEIADGSGTIFAETPTDGQGEFSIAFADGNYTLYVDPGSLPPGFVGPPPMSINVVGSTITIDGTVVSGTFVITIEASAVDLIGQVTDGSNPVGGAFIELIEATTQTFAGGAVTDSSGNYTLPLIDGTFFVQIDPFSLPPGNVPPSPVLIEVNGNTITGSAFKYH